MGYYHVIGVVISSTVTNIPTGPVIVLVVSVFVLISLLFSPNRGLLWATWRHHWQRHTIREDTLLSNLLLFSETGANLFHAHDMKALDSIGQDGDKRVFERLREKDLFTVLKMVLGINRRRVSEGYRRDVYHDT